MGQNVTSIGRQQGGLWGNFGIVAEQIGIVPMLSINAGIMTMAGIISFLFLPRAIPVTIQRSSGSN